MILILAETALLAMALKEEGIAVISICPGWVATGMLCSLAFYFAKIAGSYNKGILLSS